MNIPKHIVFKPLSALSVLFAGVGDAQVVTSLMLKLLVLSFTKSGFRSQHS